MTSPCLAETSELAIRFDSAGLSSIRYRAAEFLARAGFQVNAINFLNSDGRLSAGNLTHTVSIDTTARTTKLVFDWGAIAVQYLPFPEKLVFNIDTTNRSSFPIESLSYDAVALRFERPPVEYDGMTPILGTNIGYPTMLPMTYGAGAVVLCNDDVRGPLLVGFPWPLDRPANRVFPLRIDTGRNRMYPDSLPPIDRPIRPGMTDRFTISLRFTPTPLHLVRVTPDLYSLFRKMEPFTLKWPDRRPIGSPIIGTAAAGWPKNPRGWFLDSKLDITTKQGVAAFHERLLAWADRSVSILKSMNAQGMVTWDSEGEQFRHATTYIGDPRLIETLAPEMAGVVDEYFARFTRAGLRVGVTVRPQTVVISDGGRKVEQTASKDPGRVLIEKIGYAKKRWGATLFYIDSNGDPALPLPFGIIKRVADAYPDVLLMPEHENAAYYSKTAPYTELRTGSTSTPALVRDIYQSAFSVINTADERIDADYQQLEKAVTHGDILMFRAWYEDPANAKVKALTLRRGKTDVH